jgi:DNA-binding response OmpR family regulator
MSHILIAEDEARIAAFLEKGLQSHGFTTTIAANGLEALNLVKVRQFDLLILDLGLPKKDGLEVLEELREHGEKLPVIILTARDDIHDKVAGLEGGADDYVTKPFRFEELLARVRARLRNTPTDQNGEKDVLRVGTLVLNLRTRQITVDGNTVELPTREFIMAETFFRHPGETLSREHLLSCVWGYDYDPGSNIVDVYIGYLRKKLGSNLIETVRGVGYRLRI